METQLKDVLLKTAGYLPFATLPVFALQACVVEKAQVRRPNIIVIMADDMGYSDIGCYGSEISTPNIDRLAQNGVRFLNFYNNAKSCPSRASLLTGLYNHEAGMGRMVSNAENEIQPGPYQGFLNENCQTIAEVLKQAGYATYMSGKWHLGERKEHWPLQHGFDKYFGLISGASSYFEIIQEARPRKMAYGNQSWTPPDKGFYMTEAISDSAAAFIRSHQTNQKGEPFFLYIAYTAPHWPLHALDEDIAKFEGKYTAGWDSLREARYKKMLHLNIIDDRHQLSSPTSGIPLWEDATEKELWIRRMQVYAAMIDRMDQGIGKVLRALEDMGEINNTLILFLADNGACAEVASTRGLAIPGIPVGEKGSYDSYLEPWANASNTPYRYYKNWLYEGGIRTPLIACWPEKIKEHGVLTDQVGHLTDIMPTCMEVAGAAYQGKENLKPIRGQSLLPAFLGDVQERKDPIFWEWDGHMAMRQGDWKIVKSKKGEWELYDLATDPVELQDLSVDRKDIMERMSVAYESWKKEIGVRE